MRSSSILLYLLIVLSGPQRLAAMECDGLSPAFWESAVVSDVVTCFDKAGGGAINTQDSDGNTPLHHAVVSSQDTEVIRQLLSLGADLEVPNAENWTALHRLAALGRTASHVSALKVAGAAIDISARDDSCWRPMRECATTPLHILSKRSDAPDLLRAFLAAGADVAQRDPEGRTPLHYAASMSGADEVEALLAAGANVNVGDFEDWTPLHLAAQRGPTSLGLPAEADFSIVRILLDSDADPNQENARDQTPLMLAAAYTTDERIWVALIEATETTQWCAEDEKGRTAKMLFDLNKSLSRDASYWALNGQCP